MVFRSRLSALPLSRRPRRPGKNGPRFGEALRGGPDLPHLHRSGEPARRSSPAWASFIWRSLSTVCSASSGSRPTSASAGRLQRDRQQEVEQETKYARQSGGKGQYGHVKIRIEPTRAARDTSSTTKWWGRNPEEYIPAVDKGIQVAMLSGVLAGYPVVDVICTLYDGSFHESTPLKWHSRSPVPWRSKRLCEKPIRSSSNRS